MADYNNVENENRIVYVDPNDVRGSLNDYDGSDNLVPVIPDYTEYCLWCNLIVERSSRLKNQVGGESANEIYSIYYDLSATNEKDKYVSFMRGKDAEKYNFLTTDYTSIDYDEIRKRNIIEGLQIQNISINFVNYQTPQITIQFVDIRGGGLFGREEATHDEYGHLSNLEADDDNKITDNFFGCFVTFPYPRFKLQVKGFYGKPVTYQLTCTSFTGRFNARTGNFEITVQFIGYEYGVLGDIPFDLLVAAPLTAEGSRYWDEQVANMDKNGWALDDKTKSEAPCKLFDFYKKVTSETENMTAEELNDLIIDESLQEEMNSVACERAQVMLISTNRDMFIKSIKDAFGEHYITECVNDENDVIIIHSITSTPELSNNSKIGELCKRYNSLAASIDEYNKLYQTGVRLDLIPNTYQNGTWNKWTAQNTTFTQFLEHTTTHNNVIVTIDTKNKTTNKTLSDKTSCTDYKIQKLYADGWYTITGNVSEAIYNHLSNQGWAKYGTENIGGKAMSFAGYALAIDFKGLKGFINRKLTDLNLKYKEYSDNINNPNHKSIRDIVGFTPFIGRYFKVVMCHLETLVHLFNNCAQAIDDEINTKQRIPSKLGIINLNVETDVPSDVFKQVPPFPSVYKKYETEEEANAALINGNGKEVLNNAWLGDFVGETRWQEVSLVNDLLNGIRRIETTKSEPKEETPPQKTVDKTVDYKLTPLDIYAKVPGYAYSSEDGAVLYAALRAEVALNVMQGGQTVDDKYAEQLGMLDAFRYVQNCDNPQILTLITTENNLAQKFYNMSVYCDGFKGTEKYLYEFLQIHAGRHPVFMNAGDKIYYIYMQNKSKSVSLIPLNNFNTLTKNNGFASDYNYTASGEFVPKDVKSDNFLVEYLQTTPESTAFAKEHDKTHHFDIIDDVETITDIYTNYSRLAVSKQNKNEKTGEVEMNVEDVLDRHMLLETKSFYQTAGFDSFKDYKTYEITEKKLGTNYKELVSKFNSITF